jgi:hypothetical protein
MTSLLLFVIASKQGNRPVSLSSVLNAPEAKVVSILGPKHKGHREILFYPKGLKMASLNGFGDGMDVLVLTFNSALPWKQALAQVGVNPAGVSANPLPVVNNPVQLSRNGFVLQGIKGIRINPSTHKPWTVVCNEQAVVNVVKARGLKEQIRAAAGSDRIKLIQACYDWQTCLRLSSK